MGRGAVLRNASTIPNGSKHRWAMIGTVCLAQFVAVLIFQVVSVVLPAIGAGLAASAETLAWIAAVFPLTFGGFLLPAGRLADVAGHRRLFVVGLGLFAAASLACGLAPDVSVLIAARAAQGVGVALFTPAALALLLDAKGSAGHGMVLAAWGAAGPIGGVTGLLAGTAVTELVGWRGVFLGVVPLALLPMLLALAVIPAPTPRRTSVAVGSASALTGVAAIVTLILGLNRLPTSDALAVPLLLLAGGLLATFVVVEQRTAEPLLPPTLLRRPGLAGADAVALMHGASGNTSIFFYALFAQEALGFSPFAAGLGFLPCNGAVILGSAFGGRVVKRFGFRVLTAAGMAMVAGGLLLLSRLSVSAGYASTLLPGLLVMGFGYGLAQVGVVGDGTMPAPEADRGVAGGLLTTSAQIGSAVGLAALVALAGAAGAPIAGGDPAAMEAGFRVAYLGAAGLALGGALIATVAVVPVARD